MGRKVANEGFINGLFKADPFDEYHFFLPGNASCQTFTKFIEINFSALFKSGRVKVMDRRDLPEAISKQKYFCFHQSDCILFPPHLARIRNQFSKHIFPITGTTHSLSYSNYASFFLNYMWKGSTKRDCIIATSTMGTTVVEKYFQHLREGFELDEIKFPTPQIRKIPLGINTEYFSPPSVQQKEQALNNLEMNGEGIVNILVFGRIAHYSKMDILPLLRALQRLFARGMDRNKVRLILSGWTDEGDDFPETLSQLAKNMGLKLSIVSRPQDNIKTDLFRAADIFVSISDNPQETFGLTILEAGAMGLPVIASHYDGYRDLVINGKTGFLIDTIGTDESPEVDVMAPFCFDNQYHLLLAQQTAVLTPKLADALEELINNPELRKTMGSTGARHIQTNFTWKKVIEQYLRLWDELNSTPVNEEGLCDIKHPVQVRFGETFAHYTTSSISNEMKVVTGITGRAIYHGKEFPLVYSGLERILKQDIIRKISFFARKTITVALLVEKIKSLEPELSNQKAKFHILWCLKHDILEILCETGQ